MLCPCIPVRLSAEVEKGRAIPESSQRQTCVPPRHVRSDNAGEGAGAPRQPLLARRRRSRRHSLQDFAELPNLLAVPTPISLAQELLSALEVLVGFADHGLKLGPGGGSFDWGLGGSGRGDEILFGSG